MMILVAEDDPIPRRLLQAVLTHAGHEVIERADGMAAWDVLCAHDAPRLALLDWMMPGLSGPEICRRLRQRGDDAYTYVILLTARDRGQDIVEGLEAGADDYLTKPFDHHELLSRIKTGERIVSLETKLARRVGELQEALAHVKQLQGLLPICMHCKKIRDDHATWHRLECYIEANSGAMFTHSLCDECLAEHYPEQARRMA
jgi:sigma-B regulation protein RsbU (phosphoserine phosphatase)